MRRFARLPSASRARQELRSITLDAANPFAQMPLTPEPIIAQVRRQLMAESGTDAPARSDLVDALVDRVVRELWSSRVKTFVPILALRESRDRLRDAPPGALPMAPDAPQVVTLPAARADHAAQVRRDSVAIGRDAHPIDWHDALRVDDDTLSL